MSLVRPDFWNPSIPDFALALLDRENEHHWDSLGASAKPMDYVCSILIGVFFLGLQGCLLWALIRGSQKYAHCSRRDRAETMQPKLGKRNRPPFCFPLTLSLPPLFIIAIVVQSVNFGIRIWSLGMVKSTTGELVNSFSTTICRVTTCLETTPHFNRVARGLEMAASLLFQIMILIADLLLVIRCTVVFSDKRWVALLPGVPYLLSFASAVVGLAAIPQDFPVSSNAQVLYGYDGQPRPMSTMGYLTSVLSTSSSVAVNVIATTSIALRILASRRRALKLEDQITTDLKGLYLQTPASFSSGPLPGLGHPSHSKRPTTCDGARGKGKGHDRLVTVVAVLVESALPSAILGIFACLVHPMVAWSARAIGPLLDARFSIRILWLASTIRVRSATRIRSYSQFDDNMIIFSLTEKEGRRNSPPIRRYVVVTSD